MKITKKTEQQVIEQIVTNNGYDTSIIQHFNKPEHKKNNNNNKDSWAKFTYFTKETRAITKLFKETQLKIAFKVNNTIGKRLTPKPCNTNPNINMKEADYTALRAQIITRNMLARQVIIP